MNVRAAISLFLSLLYYYFILLFYIIITLPIFVPYGTVFGPIGTIFVPFRPEIDLQWYDFQGNEWYDFRTVQTSNVEMGVKI